MTSHRPWFNKWPADVPRTLEPLPELSLFRLLQDAAAGFPDKPATAFFGAHLTYRELLDHVERFSAVLAGLGVNKGDRVGLLLPNCPQYIIAWYACQRIGAIAVGNNPLYTQRELEHQVKDAGTEVMVVLENVYLNFGKIRDTAGVREVIATKLTDYMKFPLNKLAPLKFRKDAKKEGHPWPPIPSDHRVRWWKDVMRATGPLPPIATVDPKTDPAALIYTGGTTGLSKGATLSHFNLVSNAMQAVGCISDIRPGEDAIMCVLPFFHSFGTVAMNVGVLRAAKIAMLPRFELKQCLKEIQREKPTFFPGVPRLYLALNESEEARKYDLGSIKACISGAAPLPLATAEKFERLTGGGLVEGYGLTECSPMTHVNPLKGERRKGSIGLPAPDTECKIVDIEDPDRELAVGERGELCIRGPQVMLGYWNKPEATAEMIRNGWLHSGDIAVMDEDGYFFIVDRMKDMILVSGFNVYPTEVEDVLFHHPKILKCAVIGVPDEEHGEKVKAFIVLKPGEALTAEEIMAWCRDPAQGLTGYRLPREIEFRDSLPETMIGKVLRRVLQEEERTRAASAAPTA